MKLLIAFLSLLLLISSCQTRITTSYDNNIFEETFDELNIVYYNKDTLTYITKDTTIMNLFSQLITDQNELNEFFADTCAPTQKIIFKKNGQQIFSANVSNEINKESLGCNYIIYFLNSKMYIHRLTYRTGMAIDEIYSLMQKH